MEVVSDYTVDFYCSKMTILYRSSPLFQQIISASLTIVLNVNVVQYVCILYLVGSWPTSLNYYIWYGLSGMKLLLFDFLRSTHFCLISFVYCSFKKSQHKIEFPFSCTWDVHIDLFFNIPQVEGNSMSNSHPIWWNRKSWINCICAPKHIWKNFKYENIEHSLITYCLNDFLGRPLIVTQPLNVIKGH